MKDIPVHNNSRRPIFWAAFRYSVPVFLGYLAIGTAFGLLISDAGYPWPLALFMSLWMYAGAGQYIAVGLFASGSTILEACLIQFVVNARHIAYGLSMLDRFKGPAKPYLIFSMTDETFALLSSLPPGEKPGLPRPGKDRERFMFYVSILDQSYWVSGSLIGAVAGSFIPFNMDGIGFALTALFVVLLLEQVFRLLEIPAQPGSAAHRTFSFSLGKSGIFIVSAVSALVTVFFLPERITLLAGMVLALFLSFLLDLFWKKGKEEL